MRDTYFMKMALEMAARGEGFTSPNPMVGAVIVSDGTVVGMGYHKAAGGAHAEINAIRDAGLSAKDATLYVTLEPCNHTGRTPPCTESIIKAGIKRVVVAAKDPNPDVEGGGIKFLQQHGIEVDIGVCEDEAKKLNEVFNKYIITKRPFVTAKCAITLDGRIATKTSDSKWITGPASRKFVHGLRHACDAIMVGVETVKQDDPSLTTRLEGKKTLDPVRIILDTRLAVPENAKIFQLDSSADTLIITGDSILKEKKERIEKKGAKVIEAPVKDGLIDLYQLMDYLGDIGITSLLIEGGSRVNASAFQSGIVDKIYFFYGPKILGGDDGVPVCRGPGPALMKDAIPITGVRVRQFDDDVMVEGYLCSQE
ncbi:MAG: bifunctional diaminohydroxyphosphoribosylaminopyrimidine deaminase/5-amino-6-(5-phosphoribosylamino)uracil reductase RibD [Desulfosarcina sp.]|nr:bifunctional diaminohydroxyphosphoribosylaminopyrimidine deaminase/5-amino-6-(5-phosphoribosylamino)uracil reductase RibD [Desulfobacterales bacterium]